MRQLLPAPVDRDLDDRELRAAYATDDRPPRADRPWLLVNMIASTDGATAVDGSHPLPGSAFEFGFRDQFTF